MTLSICMDYLFDEFQIICEMFTAILVREVCLEIFLRERASEQRSGDIADNELRRGERGVVFSLPTNFHHRHECTTAVNRFAGSLRRR